LRVLSALSALLLPGFLSGCIVIPVGDLLKGPALGEQVLTEGPGVFSKRKIAIVDVSGVITGRESSHLLSHTPNSVSETKAQLDWAARDPEVKAVVLRIASPGGEVTACDIIHREIQRFREKTGAPVVACIMDHGASGGYYIACAADTIIAHPTSTVGSIGVIVQHFDLSGLLEKIGVSVDPIKSAEQKDLNSIFRKQSPDERKVLQKVVDDVYQRFIDVVVAGRPQLDKTRVTELADGRVVSGTEATALNLVDRTGYLDDAIDEARQRAGIKSPTIVRYTRRAQLGSNVYTRSDAPPVSAIDMRVTIQPELFAVPRLYYLWRP